MKKLITGILSLVVALGCFAGCNGIFPSTPSTGTSSSVQQPCDAEAAAAMLVATVKQNNSITREDYTVPNQFEFDGNLYTVVWSVKCDVEGAVSVKPGAEGELVDTIDVNENAAEDIPYTLTAVVTATDGTSATETINRKVQAAPSIVPQAITAAPVEGTAYKLYLYQVTKKGESYFTGKMSGYYYATASDYTEAVDVFVEEVEGKADTFLMYFEDENNTKQYLGLENNYSNGKWRDNVVFSPTMAKPENVFVSTYEWTWSAEHETMLATYVSKTGEDEATTESSSSTLYLGTYSTYWTFSASTLSHITDEDACVGKLVTMVDKSAVAPADKVAAEKLAVEIETSYNGDATVALPAIGKTYPEVSITWTIKEGTEAANVSVVDGKLVITAPETAVNVTLVATIACDGATDTLEFVISSKPVVKMDTIADVLAGEAGKYMTSGTVVGLYAQGFLVQDSTGTILVYQGYNFAADVAVGDVVTVEGTTSAYGGAMQFGKDVTTYEKTGVDKVDRGAAKELSAADLDAYVAGDLVIEYVSYVGQLNISSDGKYFNINVPGTSKAVGSIQYPAEDISSYNGKWVKVTGYWIGVSSGKYFNTMMIDIEEVDAPSAGDSSSSEGGDVTVETSTIATVLAGEAGTYKVEGTVVATYARGFIVKDSTGIILVFQGSAPTAAAGDVVTVEGTTSEYGGAMQFGNTATVTKTGTATVTHGTPTVVTGAMADEKIAGAVVIEYVTIEGTLSISSGKYYNVALDGASTAIGSVQYPDTNVFDMTSFDGKVIKVTGYWIGVSSGKYFNVMATEIEVVGGGDVEDSSSAEDSSSSEEGGDDLTDGLELSFADKANLTSYNTNSQVWEANGVKLTNNKASSTSDVKDYAAPARFYKSTEIIIECAGMTKIVFNANTDSSAGKPISGLTDSLADIAGITVSTNGDLVTVVFAEPTDSLTIACVAAQFRLNSLTVYTASEGGDDNSSSSEDIVDSSSSEDIVDSSSSDEPVVDSSSSEDVGGDTLTAVVPVPGQAYLFGMTQANLNNAIYYLAGGMNGYYMATTTDPSAAIETYIEATDGGYYFYTFVNGTKTYINMVVSGTHVNGAYESAASTVYTIDETNKTLIADIDGTAYWFGTRNDKTYTTMGPCAVSYNGFFGVFYGEANVEGGDDNSSSSEDIVDSSSSDEPVVDSSSSEDVGGDTLTAVVPVPGQAYIFGMTQANLNNAIYYLAGGMNGYYMETTTDPSAAIETYIEATDGGYYFYTYVDGVKTYINMVVSGTHVNGAYQATASTVYTIDETNKTLVADIDGTAYWFGTRNDKTYTTMGPCAVSYNGFFGVFYGEANAEGGDDNSSSSDDVIDSSSEDSSSEDIVDSSSSEEGGDVIETTNSADFNTIVTSNAFGDSGYKNYTTTNGWTVENAAIQTGITGNDLPPQYTVIGPDNSHKAVCLNGKTSTIGKITSPTLTGGISVFRFSHTNMFSDTQFSVTVTITGANGVTASKTFTRENPNKTKFVVTNEEWILETPITGDFTIELVNDCPSASNSNKDRITILSLTWESATAGGDEPAPHVHSYTEVVTAPTCKDAGFTTFTCDCGDTYTEAGEAATGNHVDTDLDITCDTEGCTYRILPAADSKISIFTANHMRIVSLGTKNYYVEGTVTEVKDERNGTFVITDAAGDSIIVTLPKDANGLTHANWESKVVLGDIVSVYGQPKTNTNTTTNSQYPAHIQSGVLTFVEQHAHEYSEATCYDAPTCFCGKIGGEALGHSDEDGDALCDRCKWNMNLVVESIAVRTDDGSGVADTTANTYTWSNNNFTVVVAKASGSQFYTSSANCMRVYAKNTLTLSSKNGLLVKAVVIYTTSETYLTTLETVTASLTTTKDVAKLSLTIEWNSAEDLVINNTASGQFRINAVDFIYEKKAPHTHEYKEEVTAPTCTADGFTTYTCDCGDTYTGNVVTAKGHAYFYPCDKICMVCYEETNPNATHTVVHVEAVAPTCTAMGNIEYWYCEACGSAWADEALTLVTNKMSIKLPMADHAYVGAETTAPTLNSAGVKTYTCTGCGDSYTEEIPMLMGAASVNNTNYATLAEALTAAVDGDKVTLNADVTSSEIIVLDKAIIFDGGNKTITSTAGRAINVACVGDITIQNITIIASTGCERGINIITNPSNLTLENVTVNGGSYGINFAGSANGADLTVKNSTISSWGAINVTGSEHTILVENSTLVGTNNYDAETNSFYTIALDCSNTTITVNGGTIKAVANNQQTQWIVGATSGLYSNLTVAINAEFVLEGENTKVFCFNVFTANSFKLPVAYADALTNEGFCVIADEENTYVTVGEHSYDFVVTDPTCTADGYTTYTCNICEYNYVGDQVAATGAHADDDNNYKCDGCSKVMEPANGEVLTIPQAIALANALGIGNYSTNQYYMTVTVVNIYNTTYGNANVTDAEGNKYVLYGLYMNDVRYDKLTYKPVAGDELTVYGAVGSYNSTSYQIKNAEIDEIVAHEHDYDEVVTAPTCTAEGFTTKTCSICGEITKGDVVAPLGHTTENGTCETCGQEIGGDTPALTEKTYSYTFTNSQFSANGTKALDGINWTLAGDGGYWGFDSQYGKGQQFGSSKKPYKSLTLTSDSFSNVSKITINTSGASSISGSCNVYVGDTLVGTIKLTASATNYSFDVAGLSGAVRLEYTQSSSKAIYIKTITINYAE